MLSHQTLHPSKVQYISGPRLVASAQFHRSHMEPLNTGKRQEREVFLRFLSPQLLFPTVTAFLPCFWFHPLRISQEPVRI